jgi:hypothetical protein
MITSNAVGVYSDDGKHTAPPGHDNNSTCRPASRHNRLIASRAASVTARRPPRISTRSEEPRQRCTVIACQHLDTPTATPPEKPLSPENNRHTSSRRSDSDETQLGTTATDVVGSTSAWLPYVHPKPPISRM